MATKQLHTLPLPIYAKRVLTGFVLFFCFEGPAMSLLCLADFKAQAQKQLSKTSWDFIEGEADDGITYNDNLAAFRRSALYPLHCYSRMHWLKAPDIGIVLPLVNT
jgi:hypothetical protein